jgi:predicted aminopeptidase
LTISRQINLPGRGLPQQQGRGSTALLWRIALVPAVVIGLLLLDGCYYMQAAKGQYEVMSRRRPVAEVLVDKESGDALKKRLEMVVEARQFAVDELLLPDNESYRSYADLERDYVVWNVFAAPEFSLVPRTWCYPIAGCVAYRGYFKEESARKQAEKLKADGFDVSMGGVSAYSTLGKFSDPILNTMMRWTDADLVATLIHELAHQQLYIKDDTEFNESFASTVAEIGLQMWLQSRGEEQSLDAYRSRKELRRQLVALADDARTGLEALYASEIDEETMRDNKSTILATLSTDAEELVARSGNGGGNWLRPPLNNARLASIGLYEAHVDAFRALYEQCGKELQCFYEAAEELADLGQEDRDGRLAELRESVI